MAITFDTVFKIGAVFTGQPAMDKAQAAVTALEQKGILASLSLKKMVIGLGSLAAGYFTVNKITGFINSSIDAARKAKAGYQSLYDTLSKIPQVQKYGTDVIKKQTDLLSNLSKEMQKAGGIASGTLLASFDKLSSQGFAPAKVIDMSSALQDMIVRVNGVKVTADQATATVEKFGNAVKTGGEAGGQALVELGTITQDQIPKFASLQTAQERYNFTLGEMKKHVGDTETAMKSWEGVQVRFGNAWNDLKVAIGTPFMQAQDKISAKISEVSQKLGESSAKISQVVTPIIEKLADKFSNWLISMVDNIDKLGPQIEKFEGWISKAFDYLIHNGPQVTAVLGSLGTAMGVVGTIIGTAKVADGITKIGGAIGTLKSAWDVLSKVNYASMFAMMTNPIGLTIIAIGALAVAIYAIVTHWKEIKEAAVNAWNAITTAWGNAAAWLNEKVVQPVSKYFSDLWKTISEGAQKVWDNIKDIWGSIVKWVDDNVISKITGLWNALPEDIRKALSNLFDIAIAPFKRVWEWVQEHNPVKLLTPDVSKEVQATREATLSPAQLSDTQRLMAARAEDEKLGPTHHEHFQALQKVIQAEQLAQKQQTQNTQAIAASTGALYGRSPGFIPGVQEATASLYKFESSLSQAQGSISAGIGGGIGGVGGMSLGAGGMSAATGGMSLGAGGIASSAGGIQVTHYGYEKKGDKDWDPNSAKGIGAYNNKLTPGFDVALNRKSAAMLGINYNRDLGKTFTYQGRQWRYGDRTAEWLPNPRFDVYDPGGNLVKGQYGGLVSHPSMALLGEKIPEMTIPLEGTSRSKSLLTSAAERIGMGSALGGGRGPVNLSMSAPITINGVPAGQEAVVAREVQKAMEDPIRRLLEQLKKAKQYEARLSYA